MPALALLLAWMLLQAGLAPSLGLWLCAALLVLRLAQLLPSYGASSEPWNSATAYVLSATPAAKPACVVFYPQDGREPFDYYLQQLGRPQGNPAPSLRPVLPRVAWTRVRPFVEVYGTLDAGQRASIASECPRLWLIGSHEGQAHADQLGHARTSGATGSWSGVSRGSTRAGPRARSGGPRRSTPRFTADEWWCSGAQPHADEGQRGYHQRDGDVDPHSRAGCRDRSAPRRRP